MTDVAEQAPSRERAARLDDQDPLAAYAERHRQERLAAARGEAHVGARFASPDDARDEPHKG